MIMSEKKSDKKYQDVRFVVVGAGHMGAHHVKKIVGLGSRMKARVSVIVEPDELRAQAVFREFQDLPLKPKVISNIGEIGSVGKEDYPDAAIIAVPASIHVEATAACLAKGLHCFVEKPLGYSVLDVKDLERQAESKQRILQVGLLERWSLCHLWGDWRPSKGNWTINCVRSGPFVPRAADTNVIHDLMIHDIDLYSLLESSFKLPPVVAVRAWGRKLRSNMLDHAIAALDLEGGGNVRFFASRLSAESARNWELTGPDWHASIDFMRRTMKRFERVGRDMNAFEAKERVWSGGDPLGLELEAFVSRVRGDFSASVAYQELSKSFATPEQVIPTAQTVLRTHEIIDEILSCIKVLES
jgi:predicted dehydrogenase